MVVAMLKIEMFHRSCPDIPFVPGVSWSLGLIQTGPGFSMQGQPGVGAARSSSDCPRQLHVLYAACARSSPSSVCSPCQVGSTCYMQHMGPGPRPVCAACSELVQEPQATLRPDDRALQAGIQPVSCIFGTPATVK